MKILFLIITQLLMIAVGFAQSNIEKVLSEIEQNNTQLAAFEKQIEARHLSNRTDIYLQNPEFEYAWFAGSPSTIGSKTNISLRQHFDFPTAYTHKHNIADKRNEQLATEYERQRRDILLEARLVYLELIYYNALLQEYEKRVEHAERIAQAQSTMLEAGETNIIEYNKAKLNLLNLTKEKENAAIHRESLQNQLSSLNGGHEITITETKFPGVLLADNFDEWYTAAENNNPEMKWIRQEIEISQRQIKLQRAMNLPSFSAAFVSEALTHEQFRGFAIGLSIPLLENKNKLSYAKANTLALESIEQHEQVQYYNFLKTNHTLAQSLLSSTMEYRSVLQTIDQSELLATAWEQGAISLTSYFLELAYLYESTNKILEMELELHQTLAVLNKYID